MQETTFCQSCAMPLNDEELGTEKDGTKNPFYCCYCYKDGAFTTGHTMEEMIEVCAPYMVQANPEMTIDQARAQMQAFFPTLKRWAKT